MSSTYSDDFESSSTFSSAPSRVATTKTAAPAPGVSTQPIPAAPSVAAAVPQVAPAPVPTATTAPLPAPAAGAVPLPSPAAVPVGAPTPAPAPYVASTLPGASQVPNAGVVAAPSPSAQIVQPSVVPGTIPTGGPTPGVAAAPAPVPAVAAPAGHPIVAQPQQPVQTGAVPVSAGAPLAQQPYQQQQAPLPAAQSEVAVVAQPTPSPAEEPKEIVFGGTVLRRSATRKHAEVLPIAKRAAEAQRNRDKRVLVNARTELLKKRMMDESARPKSTSETTPAPAAAQQNTQGALVVHPSTDESVSQYDAKHGLTIPLTSACAAAFSLPADKLTEYVEKETAKVRCEKEDFVNTEGYVPYQYRMLGLKKVAKRFQLGFGRKATPLQFAVVACRADNVIALLKLGAIDRPAGGLPTAKEIAEENGYSQIAQLFVPASKRTSK